MQVGESEAVGTIDDDGVGVGYVDAVLDDGGREQHVVVVVLEVEDDFLQLLRFHLSVTHCHAGVRDVLLDHLTDARQVVDAWVDEVDLSVARHLEIDGIGDNLRTQRVYLRLYGITVGRWRLDDAQVASPHQRELQGTRYGCCRQCQRVDIGLQLAQLLLGRDAKLLLLIDDEQSQVAELHRLTDELVRTYYNIYLAVCQVLQECRGLLGATGSREVVHTDGHILQS